MSTSKLVTQLAAKCYREIGDEARTFYLDKTVELAEEEGDGDCTIGMFVMHLHYYCNIYLLIYYSNIENLSDRS